MGLMLDVKIKGTVRREFSFWYIVETGPRSGSFNDPILLSVAANRASGKNGAILVTKLLSQSNRLLEESNYRDYSSVLLNDAPSEPIERNGSELPSDSACDSTIKCIYHLAEFECFLSQTNASTPAAVEKLKLACEMDSWFANECVFIKDYLEAFKKCDSDFQGVKYKLKKAQVDQMLNHPEFEKIFSYTISPGLFSKYWHLLSMAAYFTGMYGCFGSENAKALGSWISSIFTDTLFSSAVNVSIGLTVIGFITFGLFCFLKHLKDSFLKEDVHFPIKEVLPTVSKYSGALFARLPIAQLEGPKMDKGLKGVACIH